MKTHWDLTNQEFETQFQDATLEPELFTHEAHLRLAWIQLRHSGQEKAIDQVCRQLITYVTALGARDKYHVTVTVAAVKAVQHFMNKSQADKFRDFIMEFPRLKHNFKELLSMHYSEDIFSSQDAKSGYLEPDLMPFDE